MLKYVCTSITFDFIFAAIQYNLNVVQIHVYTSRCSDCSSMLIIRCEMRNCIIINILNALYSISNYFGTFHYIHHLICIILKCKDMKE